MHAAPSDSLSTLLLMILGELAMVNTNNLSRKTNRKIDLRLARSERILSDQSSHRIKHAMTRQRLSVVTGTTDEDLLDQLVDLGFSEDNLEAIRYAPIAEVAWASGRVTQFEQVFAVSAGVSSDMLNVPVAFDLFQSWLVKRPDKTLWSAWEQCTVDRMSRSGQAKEREFGRRLHEIATRVALASGGLLDQGEICIAEQRVLDRIARVYNLSLCSDFSSDG
jgi:hypothetical protein